MNTDQFISATAAQRESMLRRERVALEKALREMVADYKSNFPEERRIPTDNEIRATAKRHGCDACSLYAAFKTMPDMEKAYRIAAAKAQGGAA